jgi:hypothetical protein
MRELNFDTGLVTYRVNGKCEISFNPADVSFVNRIFKAFDSLAKRQDDAKIEAGQTDGEDLFELAEQRDKYMREQIDNAFGEPVSDKIFGKLSVFALAGGLPLWCNFLMAVVDEIDVAIQEEQRAASPTVDKYMAKYAKYKRK